MMGLATVCIFEILENAWQSVDCSLVDMKIEFGVDTKGICRDFYATIFLYSTYGMESVVYILQAKLVMTCVSLYIYISLNSV